MSSNDVTDSQLSRAVISVIIEIVKQAMAAYHFLCQSIITCLLKGSGWRGGSWIAGLAEVKRNAFATY